MLRRFCASVLVGLSIFLSIAISSKAQQQPAVVVFPAPPTGTCTIPLQQALDTSSGNLYKCVGGSWQLVGPAPLNGGVVISGSPTVGQVPTATDAGRATWQNSGGGDGTTIYVNQVCGAAANCVSATSGLAFFDCTYANASPTVTCTASDNLSTIQAGWRIMLTCCGGSGGTNHIGSALETTAGTTVLSVNNGAHTITMSGNATNTRNSVVGQSIVVGPLSDTALASAATASLGNGGRCFPLNIGSGLFLVSQGFANTSTCKNEITNSATTGWGAQGNGPGGRSGTTIVPVDNFNFATCTGQNDSCFFGVPGASVSNLAIWGADNSTNVNGSTCGTNSKAILDQVTDTLFYNILIAGWCANDGALVGIRFDPPGGYCIYCIVDGAGGLGGDVKATSNPIITHSFFGDTNGFTSSGLTVSNMLCESGSGTTLTTSDSGFGAAGNNTYQVGITGCTWFSEQDRNLNYSSSNNTYANLGLNAIAHVSKLLPSNTSAPNASDADFFLSDASAKLFIGDSQLVSGASNFAFNCTTTSQVYDQGGNTLLNGVLSNCTKYIADGHSVKGTCTGSATASSTLGLYGTGPNATTTTCTSTTIGSGVPMNGARTLSNLVCVVGVAGTTSSTCTVLVNGSASALTCTIAGAATSCVDNTHTVAAADGALVSEQFVSGAATTPSGVSMSVKFD